MKFFKLALILSLTALFIFSCSQGANNTANNSTVANNNQRTNTLANANAPANSGNTSATPADEAAAGKAIYKENCVKCHKENGAGGEVVVMGTKRKAASLISEGAKKDSDAEVIDYIANGIPDEGMPAFKNTLSDEQIRSVVKFIRQDLQAKK
jgi:mono/diheme cytochrome c family protein